MSQPVRGSEIYRYEDDAGVPHFVHDLRSVPKKYRDQAKRVDGPQKGVFVYEDAAGQPVISDRWSEIPEEYRASAKKLDASATQEAMPVPPPPRSVRKMKAKVQHMVSEADPVDFVKNLDVPSILIGVALSFIIYVVLGTFRKTGSRLLKFALVLAAVMLAGQAYLGWLQRSTGLSESPLASPADIIEDACQAASQLKASMRSREQTLKKVEEDSK